MDDGSLFGKIADVLKAWNIIKEVGPELGLFVNLQKCELISSDHVVPAMFLMTLSLKSSRFRMGI